jgi:integrase
VPRPSRPGPITSDEVRTAAAGYRPNGAGHDQWDEIGPFVRDAVVSGGCTSLAGVYVALRAMTSFVAWTHSQGMPLDREAILDEPTVERFVAVGLNGISNRSRATYASTLRRIGRLATRRAYWSPEPPKYSHKVLAPPYRGDEVDWMWEIARTQKTPGRTRGALALLSLALCAGLKAHEVGAVRASDIEFRDDAVLVHVRGGRPRTVPVLPRAHTALRSLCEEYEGR